MLLNKWYASTFCSRTTDHEAAYTYSSVIFLHPLLCHCLRYQSISFVFLFVSRYIYADPLHCNMTYLFIRLLKDDLKEYTYAARLSGLIYGIASGMNAILVSKKKTQEEMKQLGSCWAWRKHLTSAFSNEMVNGFFSLAYVSWIKGKAKLYFNQYWVTCLRLQCLVNIVCSAIVAF